jgi:hypothetical protein
MSTPLAIADFKAGPVQVRFQAGRLQAEETASAVDGPPAEAELEGSMGDRAGRSLMHGGRGRRNDI